MLRHNEHHAAELDQMADKLRKAGMDTAAEQIRKAVDEFQKGNLYLSVALATVKRKLTGGGIMCLAAVYKAQDPETKLFEFVSRIDVDGETITLTDVMGEQKVLEGTIVMVDLANSIMKINCTES